MRRIERELYTPEEVARLFSVDPKTITRWAKLGRIPDSEIVWTLGGHRRYRRAFIDSQLNGRRR